MGSRGGVPDAEVIDVHHGDDRAAPPAEPAASPHDDVGDCGQTATVDRHRDQVDRHAPRSRPCRSASRASDGGRHRGPRPGGPRSPPTALATAASDVTTTASGIGAETSSPHSSPRLTTITRPAIAPSATIPRRRQLGDLAGDGTSRCRRRDDGDLAGEVDQLLHRAHEVAAGHLLVADHRAQGVPGHPPVGRGEESRIGRPMCSQAARPLLGGQVLADGDDAQPALPRGGVGEPRWRRRLGAAVLVDEHRQQAGELGCIDVVEQTDSEALGDQQVTLVEHAGEHRPLVGQRPAVARARSR